MSEWARPPAGCATMNSKSIAAALIRNQIWLSQKPDYFGCLKNQICLSQKPDLDVSKVKNQIWFSQKPDLVLSKTRFGCLQNQICTRAKTSGVNPWLDRRGNAWKLSSIAFHLRKLPPLCWGHLSKGGAFLGGSFRRRRKILGKVKGPPSPLDLMSS